MEKLKLLKKKIKLYSEKAEKTNEFRRDILDTLDDVVIELKKKVEGKSTTKALENMNDITMLQLTGIITEEQLKDYSSKYKEYPMILNFLKQIGESNGYKLSFKSMYDVNKSIENLEIKTKEFLENYENTELDYKTMISEENNYYDTVMEEINEFMENNIIKITKI